MGSTQSTVRIALVEMLLLSHGFLQLALSLPAAGLTFVTTKVSKTICGTELGIHASNNCATASLQKPKRYMKKLRRYLW
jgi:hypothetical protein